MVTTTDIAGGMTAGRVVCAVLAPKPTATADLPGTRLRSAAAPVYGTTAPGHRITAAGRRERVAGFGTLPLFGSAGPGGPPV